MCCLVPASGAGDADDAAGGEFAGIKQKWSKRKLSTIVSDEIRETNRSRVDLMNEAQIDEFREAFTQFDIDKSGSIDVQLLDQVAIKEGPNETKVLSNLKDMDADKDGELTFEEMKAYFKKGA